MNAQSRADHYFPQTIQISHALWSSLKLGELSLGTTRHALPQILFFRQVAHRLNRAAAPEHAPTVHASSLALYATLLKIQRHIIDDLAEQQVPGILEDAAKAAGYDLSNTAASRTIGTFVELFPPSPVLDGVHDPSRWLAAPGNHRRALREMLLLHTANSNPALLPFRSLHDDTTLAASSPAYRPMTTAITGTLEQGPLLDSVAATLGQVLLAPLKIHPTSLADQLAYIRQRWEHALPPALLEEVTIAFDILREEERQRGWSGGEPGPPPVMEFGRGGAQGGVSVADGSSIFGGYDYPEHEAFSADADWMPNVVLMAKMVYVWLGQLSKQYGYPITRLDQVPDAELEQMGRRGFTGLWLIGVWERSVASQRIKQLCGNPEAIASAYSLYDYEIAADLGGWEALANLRERAGRFGIRLASDMVPNHTGIYSRWVLQHPDWFVQTDYPPFPTYQFNGENLSHSETMVLQVEDGYWTKTDAAVVFRMIEHSTGRCRYIYHGNDGTSIPWNDTAQLNYLLPEVREAVIQTILHVARNFPIIRFDAAMTLAKKHYQRLWFPIRGLGGGIPSRAEHGMSRDEFDALFPVEFWREVVDRVAAEAPGTLLLAEAFWLMEGYFVRTLGMHRVYNSAFMNMLKKEENAKYRQTIRNVLEFNPEVLQRFVNFMNNPDEKTAVEQFGSQGKYFGACLLLSTMPGLPMFGHGQIEGFHEKYGMEYKQAYWDEQVDDGLVRGHEMWIFPVLQRRWLFSGAENFALFDFWAGEAVDENVYAYSNRCGEHRSLVLYHNCHARTSGWIRESAAFAVKTGNGDETELQRTTLGQALAVSADDAVYYAFRDHTRGLEYLRSGRELHDKGLFAELGEYEFHVFLDFHELRDDEEGWWGKLCRHLNGSGAENLHDELKQLRYPELNDTFRAALQQPGAASVKRFAAASGESDQSDSSDLLQRIILLAELTDQLDALPLLTAWLLLRDQPAVAMERFGLDCTLRRQLSGDLTRHAPALVSTLCSLPPAGGIAGMLSDPASRMYLQVHVSRDIEWFNKERFEELTLWAARIDLLLSKKKITAAALIAADKLALQQSELAFHAGYRVKLLRELATVQPKKGATPAASPGGTGKKPAVPDKKPPKKSPPKPS